VLWFSEAFVQSLIKPHLELRPIQVLLESSTRAVEFSDSVRAKARIIICDMLHQTAEDRLPALLQLLLLLARDTKAQTPRQFRAAFNSRGFEASFLLSETMQTDPTTEEAKHTKHSYQKRSTPRSVSREE
jgi:hypothetical protein